MKIIRIGSVWCSSCIIMKSRFNEVIKEKGVNADIKSLDYDMDDVSKYNVSDILPVYIKFDNNKEIRLIGEHTKEEIERFLA